MSNTEQRAESEKEMRHTHGCCADQACNADTCMELQAGKTCGDCHHFRHCAAFYARKATDTNCDFYPRRFVAALTRATTS